MHLHRATNSHTLFLDTCFPGWEILLHLMSLLRDWPHFEECKILYLLTPLPSNLFSSTILTIIFPSKFKPTLFSWKKTKQDKLVIEMPQPCSLLLRRPGMFTIGGNRSEFPFVTCNLAFNLILVPMRTGFSLLGSS